MNNNKIYPYLLLIIILSIFFIFSFKYNYYWIGGDSLPLFYANDFLSGQTYTRLSQTGLGSIGNSGGIILIPIKLIINYMNLIFSKLTTQYIGNIIYFNILGLGFYYFTGLFSKDFKIRFSVTIFYIFNFLLFLSLTRNIIFINFLFAFSPIFYRKFIENGNKLSTFLILLIFGYINSIISLNPWTIIVQFLGLIGISYYKKVPITKFIIRCIFSYTLVIIPLSSQLIFLNYNKAIISDDRNNKILIELPLLNQKKQLSLLNSIRGYSKDLEGSRGFYKGKLYYPFPQYKLFNDIIPSIASFFFIFILIILLISDKNKKTHKAILLLLLSIFIFKGNAEPLGYFFEYLIKKISIFGIFRNPQTKLSFLYIIFISIIIITFAKKTKHKKIFLLLVIFYSILFGYPILTNSYSQITNLAKPPIEYNEAQDYINNNTKIGRILPLPYNDSTRYSTNFGYEGYNIFNYLLKDKHIINLNDGAFSEYNKKLLEAIKDNIILNKKSNVFEKYSIDTIILDKNIDNYSRFSGENYDFSKIQEKIKENFYIDKKIGNIEIRTYKNKIINKFSYKNANSFSFSKINPTKYRIKVSSITGSADLSFLQSFHNERKLFPDKSDKLSEKCQISEKYNSYIESGAYITGTNHTVLEGETLYTIAKNYSSGNRRRESDYIYDINNLSGATVTPGQNLIIQPEIYPEMIQTATGNITECIQSGYTFYEGEELSYLRAKPLREDNHHLVYDYANGRNISLTGSTGQAILQQGLSEGRITTNPDGSYDISLVLYFRPQSWFYLGLGISGSTFLALLIWLIAISFGKRKDDVGSGRAPTAGQ